MAEPNEAPAGYMAGFTGVKRTREPSPLVDADPGERIKDMDHEGVDVNLTLPSGWFGTWTAGDDVVLEMAMYRAYHRWMADYCGAYPNRLGGVILAGARDVDGALAEIHRWGRSNWAWGLMVYAPVGMPLDHPTLEPVYAAAAELDLAVVLHTFTVMPPYAPGGQDTWDNLWLQRSAAHPWCGMRNMAAMIGSGVMDRYPSLRVGTLEAGHGWLPFWMARLDEHAETIKAALPELGQKPSEYVTGGRYFQSIEIPEGAKLTNAVIDLDGVFLSVKYAIPAIARQSDRRTPGAARCGLRSRVPHPARRQCCCRDPVRKGRERPDQAGAGVSERGRRGPGLPARRPGRPRRSRPGGQDQPPGRPRR